MVRLGVDSESARPAQAVSGSQLSRLLPELPRPGAVRPWCRSSGIYHAHWQRALAAAAPVVHTLIQPAEYSGPAARRRVQVTAARWQISMPGLAGKQAEQPMAVGGHCDSDSEDS